MQNYVYISNRMGVGREGRGRYGSHCAGTSIYVCVYVHFACNVYTRYMYIYLYNIYIYILTYIYMHVQVRSYCVGTLGHVDLLYLHCVCNMCIVYTYIYVYVNVYLYIHILVYIYKYIYHIYIHICIRILIHIYEYIYKYIYLHTGTGATMRAHRSIVFTFCV